MRLYMSKQLTKSSLKPMSCIVCLISDHIAAIHLLGKSLATHGAMVQRSLSKLKVVDSDLLVVKRFFGSQLSKSGLISTCNPYHEEVRFGCSNLKK